MTCHRADTDSRPGAQGARHRRQHGQPHGAQSEQSGHSLKVYDLSEEVVNFIVQSGAKAASSIKHAAGGVDFVITMPPRWVRSPSRQR